MINMNRGYLYALVSSLLLSSSVVINKYLLGFVNSRMLSFMFFASVFVGSSVFLLYRKTGFLANIRSHWKDGIIVGGFNALAATLFFFSLSLLDASTTSFLVRFSTIFIILIGVFFLKERLTLYDYLGMALAVTGALLISYSNGGYTKLGLVVALTAAFAIALHQITAKMFVRKISPLALVNLRTFFSSLFILLLVFATSSFQPIDLKLIPLIFVTGAVIAMSGFFFFYKSLELIEVSKAAIIRTADPFIILIYGLVIFRTIPGVHEVTGGSLIFLGVAVIILKRRIGRIVAAFRPLSWFE
ncbi:DMT family transporter [Candidatus Woesearchaeota archaeon]|nr:DMT family transporter [Candidatus Woesearchaeota archaeon]